MEKAREATTRYRQAKGATRGRQAKEATRGRLAKGATKGRQAKGATKVRQAKEATRTRQVARRRTQQGYKGSRASAARVDGPKHCTRVIESSPRDDSGSHAYSD